MVIPIVLDRASRNSLLGQRAERARGTPAPLRWHGLLDELSLAETNVGAAAFDWRHAAGSRARLLAWQPSSEVMATALASRSLVYLCWGVPQTADWKRRALALVLRRARHVLVNDTTTQREVAALAGRSAAIVPFFIDPEFFAYRPLAGRDDFLFCNGSNDRDGEVLVGLAERGFKLVWLVGDPTICARYAGRSANLQIRSGISHVALRDLNQTCAVALMPITSDRHCAGQTTGLEAVACGAPLLISAGRTASIFAGLPSVRVVERGTSVAAEIEIWTQAIGALLADRAMAAATERARRTIEQRLSRTALRDALAPFLDWPAAAGQRAAE